MVLVMKTFALTTSLGLLAFASTPALAQGSFVVRVGRAETVSKGTIENAVIYVEDGKIAAIGEDLPVDRGIPVYDRPDWVALPGFVNCYSRLGCDSEGGDEMSPEVRASDELWPDAKEYDEVVKYGVTTLGLYPAGNGIPGLAVAVRPKGETAAEMILQDPAYLKIILRADAASKKRIADGFKKADEHADKVKKAREKWDKDQEKKKGSKKEEKKDEPKPEEKKGAFEEPKEDEKKAEGDKKADGFVAPEPDAKSKAFVELRAKTLRAMVSIGSSADYAHWIDAIGDEDILWSLRTVLNIDADYFYVASKKTYDLEFDGIGDRHARVVIEPVLTRSPNTMRLRNLPLEFANAGAKIAFIPRNDTLADHKLWLAHVAELVAAGLPHDLALRAMTLEPAEELGLAARLGSLEKGKDANIVFVNGDPFEPTTKVQAVLLEGESVFGEVAQ